MGMDLYQTNSSFQPEKIIDNYESLVWTDRYGSCGDFELTVPWSSGLAQNLKSYKFLASSISNRVMMVETVEKSRESNIGTGSLVKLSGRSLEAFLDFRNNKTFDLQDSVVKTGSRGAIANEFIDENVVSSATTWQNLPGLVIASPPSGTSVTLTVERGPIYSMVKQILNADDIGFKMYRTATPGEIIWKVYEGLDYSGNVFPDEYREFSPDDESLVNVSSLESVANYKNYFTMIGAKTSVGLGYDTLLGGYSRRAIVVDAQDIGPDTTTTVGEDQQALILRAAELRKTPENAYTQLVDGEVPQDIYLSLGDIAWVKDSYGVKNLVRVSELIWTSDATGNPKRVPTFEAV